MNTYLAHSGILKMKWGVRRWQNPDGTLTEAGKLRYRKMRAKNRKAAAAKKAASIKKNESQNTMPQQSNQRRVQDLTDQELRDLINRYNLEKQYIQMITPQQVAPSKTVVQTYMSKFGTTLAETLVKEAATGVAKKIVKSVLKDNSKTNGNKKKNNED